MSNENRMVSISVYDPPPIWYELSVYVLAILLMAGAIASGNVAFIVGVTACLMYWNYRYFRLIGSYIRLLNASEFNRVLDAVRELKDDGTFPANSGLSTDKDDNDEKAED